MANGRSVTTGEVAERIRASGVIAIVLPDIPDLAVIGSATALVAGLRRLEKTVSVFAPPALPSTALVPWAFPDAESEPLREFIISFDLTRSPIKELKYERDSNRLNIILSPTASRIRREDIEFRYGPLRYDLVITIGVPRLASANASLAKVPELLYEKPVVNIDTSPANDRYGELNLILTSTDESGAATIAEAIHDILTDLKALPDRAESATALFVALAAETKNFRPTITSANAFRIAADLRAAGADAAFAERSLTRGRPLGVEQLLARAVARSRYESGGSTAWATLIKEDFQKTDTDGALAPQALEAVAMAIPQAERAVLLWQNPDDNLIHALVHCCDVEERARLAAQGAPETAAGYLALLESHSSFPAAEEGMRALLGNVDGVQ